MRAAARIEAIKARLDKARTEAGGKAGLKDIATDSFVGSLQRPVGGALSAAIGGLTGSDPGSSFTERYKASVENENERMARAEKEQGLLGTAVGVGASLPLAAATGGGAAATLPKLIGQGTALGAASGMARHAESTDTAAKGALEGGLEGGAAAGVFGAAGKLLPGARRVAATEKQIARGATPEEGKAAAKEFYKEMDKGGVSYAKPQTAMVKKGLDDLVATNQYDPIAHQKISGLFSKLDQAVTQPQGATLTELHNLRSAFAKEARGADASTREAAGKVVGTIDDLVHGSRPAINPNNLDVKNLHKEASQKWRSAALADDIEWREGKAATKLAVSPGTSADTANRAAFKPVLDRANKPGAYNPYTDEQKALLAKIVSGDRGQNIARNVGRTATSPITRSHRCRSGRGAWLWAWGSVCSRWSCTRREQGPAGCWSDSGCLGRAPGSEEYRCAAAQHQRSIERYRLAQRSRSDPGRANSARVLVAPHGDKINEHSLEDHQAQEPIQPASIQQDDAAEKGQRGARHAERRRHGHAFEGQGHGRSSTRTRTKTAGNETSIKTKCKG